MAREKIISLLFPVALLIGILSGCGGHVMPEPALDFDTLQEARYFYINDMDTKNALLIGENVYQHYCNAQPLYPSDYIREAYTDANVPAEAKQGEVIAYTVLDGHFISYYAEIKGLSADDWLLRFYDDGTGAANEKNVMSIYKNIEVTVMPDWLQKVYDIENAPPPASDTDMDKPQRS